MVEAALVWAVEFAESVSVRGLERNPGPGRFAWAQARILETGKVNFAVMMSIRNILRMPAASQTAWS